MTHDAKADRAPWEQHVLTAQGLAMLTAWEGGPRPPYKDAHGLWTAGVGHRITTQAKGKNWLEDWSKWLRDDCAKAENCVADEVTWPLHPYQADALIILIFNIGCAAFASSFLRRVINEGDKPDLKAHWAAWHYVAGRPNIGLIRRRAAEYHLFVTGDYQRP